MKTKKEILEAVKNETLDRDNCKFVDSRDYARLVHFFPVKDWEKFGLKLKEGAGEPKVEEYTIDNVMEYVKRDLDFAFEKAINHRGISSSLMFDVMKMWMWILEDELADTAGYGNYGIFFYSKIAKKYDLPDRMDEYDDGDWS
jgi:hypothetical protein